MIDEFFKRFLLSTISDCNPGIPNPEIPDGFPIPEIPEIKNDPWIAIRTSFHINLRGKPLPSPSPPPFSFPSLFSILHLPFFSIPRPL